MRTPSSRAALLICRKDDDPLGAPQGLTEEFGQSMLSDVAAHAVLFEPSRDAGESGAAGQSDRAHQSARRHQAESPGRHRVRSESEHEPKQGENEMGPTSKRNWSSSPGSTSDLRAHSVGSAPAINQGGRDATR